MKTIKLNLDCGESTCASEPGKFCQFFGSMRFGTIAVCRLFPSDDGAQTELFEKDGWIQRCEACKAATQ